jgi:hypothetical protein
MGHWSRLVAERSAIEAVRLKNTHVVEVNLPPTATGGITPQGNAVHGRRPIMWDIRHADELTPLKIVPCLRLNRAVPRAGLARARIRPFSE